MEDFRAQITSVQNRDIVSYVVPYYDSDDFAQDRLNAIAIAFAASTLSSHRRKVAMRFDELRRLIHMGIPRHLQENAEYALSSSIEEWDQYIDVHRTEQQRARLRLLYRPLLNRLLDQLSIPGRDRVRTAHRVRRNLLQFLPDETLIAGPEPDITPIDY